MNDPEILKKVLDKVAQSWDLNPDKFELIRDVMNPVYFGFTNAGEKVIARLTEGGRRTQNDILAEIEWLEYLNKSEDCFCKLLANKAGDNVETICIDNVEYHVSCFHFQKGKPQINAGEPGWGDKLFQDMGGIAGKIHRLTANFKPFLKRHAWDDEEVFKSKLDFETNVPANVLDAIWNHLDKLRNLPTDSGYHIIHGDIKQDNVFYKDDGSLFLYDFDQSCVCWNIYDLVVSFYFNFSYPLCRIPGATDDDAKNYINQYIQGYNKEYNFDDKQLALIPDLLVLREALLYLIVKNIEHKLTSDNNPGMADSFNKAYKEMEARIADGTPHFEFDFTKL